MFTMARVTGSAAADASSMKRPTITKGCSARRTGCWRRVPRCSRRRPDVASAQVRTRLAEMAEFYLVTRESMESALRYWRERKTTA